VTGVAFFAALTTSVPNNNIDLETGELGCDFGAALPVHRSLGKDGD
jgi:hypothetical protein